MKHRMKGAAGGGAGSAGAQRGHVEARRGGGVHVVGRNVAAVDATRSTDQMVIFGGRLEDDQVIAVVHLVLVRRVYHDDLYNYHERHASLKGSV